MMTMLSPFDNVFDDMWHAMEMAPRFTDVPTNVREDSDSYTIEMAVPGLERKNFHLKVHDGDLCLRVRKGHRFSCPWKKNHTYIRGERHMQIPSSIDAKKITAKVDNGILYICLPKKESYVGGNSHNTTSNCGKQIQVA